MANMCLFPQGDPTLTVANIRVSFVAAHSVPLSMGFSLCRCRFFAGSCRRSEAAVAAVAVGAQFVAGPVVLHARRALPTLLGIHFSVSSLVCAFSSPQMRLFVMMMCLQEWEDLIGSDGSMPASSIVNENTVRITVTPSTEIGQPPHVFIFLCLRFALAWFCCCRFATRYLWLVLICSLLSERQLRPLLLLCSTSPKLSVCCFVDLAVGCAFLFSMMLWVNRRC